jgi:hypothetical protein
VEDVAAASVASGAACFPRFDDDPSSSMILLGCLTQTTRFP